MSLALARKYRPKRFADVAVQSHVSATLKGAIERGRVAQGYLLCGPRGVGKTTLARVLAMALNCENRQPDGEPCGVCSSCTRIWSGSASLDVVEIDAASNRGVDDARELRERAMYAPSGDDRYKVYIVDEAHMLTREAWNALLKILEEPPPRVVFVFATTEPQKIAQTAAPVLSRLQRFDFKRMGAGDVKARLELVLREEHVGAEPDALAMIARAADGSMRDALSLTDQVLSMGEGAITTDRVREALGLVAEDEFIALMDLIAERRGADVFPFVARLADAGVDFAGFLTGLADVLRAQLAIALGGTAPDVSDRAREALVARRGKLSAADLLRMLGAITELEPRFRKSGQQQLLLETLLVRFALLDRSIDLEEVLRQLGGGSGGGGGDGGRAPAGERERIDRALWEPPAGQGRERSANGRPTSESTSGAVPAAPSSSAAASMSRPAGASASATIEPPRRAPEAAPPAAPRAAVPPAPVPAPASPAGATNGVAGAPVDLNRVVERWDELAARLRAMGKSLVATAIEHSSPAAVTVRGELAIELDEANDIFAQAIDSSRAELLGALRDWFPSLERVQLRGGAAAPATPPRRLTDHEIRADRIAALKKRDPSLGAAIDALDLDVLD